MHSDMTMVVQTLTIEPLAKLQKHPSTSSGWTVSWLFHSWWAWRTTFPVRG